MSRSYLITLALLAGAAVPLHADSDVAYVPMSVCPTQPYASLRDYWDQTHQFCFESHHRRQTWTISDMDEVILRHDNQWRPGPYLDALTDENRATVARFEHYAIRYLALGLRDALGGQPFVVQVFYGGTGGPRLTTYAFGEIDARGRVRLTGYSDADAPITAPRTVFKTIRNVFAVFRNQDPNRLAVQEVKREERRRITPAADVVRHYGAPSALASPR